MIVVRSFLLLCVLCVGACQSRELPSAPPSPPLPKTGAAPAARESFTAVVRVVEDGGAGKTFRGVMLEREDGARWVVRYGVDALWKAFADERVVVEGERHAPEGQALTAVHFRVGRFRHAERARGGHPVDYFEVSEPRTLRGRYEDAVGDPGTKSEGVRYVRFVEESGAVWRIDNAPKDAPRGQLVTIRARVLDMVQLVSVAAVGGPRLFVVDGE